jgi:hypothetical protein
MRIGIALITLILFFSGCLFGGDATNTAHQLAGVRDAYISNGLLAPSSSEQRDAYRNEILPFRNTINSIAGNDGAALKDYLDGSLALLSTIEKTDEALSFLENVNMDAPECGTNSPIMKAVRTMDEAQTNATTAAERFAVVQKNPSIANALGANYILNAAKTMNAVAQTHGERVKELKLACGFSV